MIMLVFIILSSTAFLLSALSHASYQRENDKVTNDALAQAKAALIGFSAKNTTPGMLPCPEQISLIGSATEGSADGSCSNTLPTIGRLPWRTLGIGPLKDSNGEILWYVLSPGFRTSPINSDSPSQLAVDGTSNSAVAIIFSPGIPINGQVRPTPTASTPPNVTQYLELSNNIVNSTSFVTSGPASTFNDKLKIITHSDLFQMVEKRVAREVVNALNVFYCGSDNVHSSGGCIAAGGERYYPQPANFNDSSCLGNASITSGCNGISGLNNGRIPATLLPAPPVFPAWDSTSILRGPIGGGNWFQSNGWRELIFYAVATACTEGTTNCSGAGFLTLNNPPASASNNQKVVVIAMGKAIGSQLPHTGLNRNNPNNYLEDENLTLLDDIFTKNATSPFNDIATSIP